MKRATLFLLILGASITQGFAQEPRAQAPPPVIVVNGNAQIEANPDAATVRLGVVRQETSAQSAQDQANRAVQAMLSEITKLGIPAQHIQTSRLTLSPVYAPRGESRDAPRIAAYSASNIVSVELDNLAQVGPVIDAGLRTGTNQLEGVQFRLKNDLPVRERALREAVTEARRKAETMADALGVRLNGVQEASEGGVSIVPKGQGGFVALARAEATQTPVSPGQLEVSANVTVRYFIVPR